MSRAHRRHRLSRDGRVVGLRSVWPLAVICALLTACGGESKSSSGPVTPSSTTTFNGTISGVSGETGTLNISIQTTVAALSPARVFPPFHATLHAQTTASVNATGTLLVSDGSTVSLVGTYNTSTRALSLSGGGFSFSGTVASGVLSGSYTGPKGTGGFSSVPSNGTTTAYCGTMSAPEGVGALSLTVASAGTVTGLVTRSQVCSITGQATASSMTLTTCDGTTATGSIQNGSGVVGTTSRGGTFSASTSGCTTATNPTAPKTYLGLFNGQWTRDNAVGGVVSCSRTATFSGIMSMTVTQRTDGTVSGTARVTGTDTQVSASPNCAPNLTLSGDFAFNGDVTGTPASLAFTAQEQVTNPGSDLTITNRLTFSGVLSGGAISGTASRSTSGSSPTTGTVNAATTFQVTLR